MKYKKNHKNHKTSHGCLTDVNYDASRDKQRWIVIIFQAMAHLCMVIK